METEDVADNSETIQKSKMQMQDFRVSDTKTESELEVKMEQETYEKKTT